MSSTDIKEITEELESGVSWNEVVKKHWFRNIGGGADIIVRQQIENRRIGKYAYLVFSFSKSFLDYLGATNEISFYVNGQGIVGLKNGDSMKMHKMGNRMVFKIIKNKVAIDICKELSIYIEHDNGKIEHKNIVIKNA